MELDVTGVSAEALLKVRLERLVRILDRALATIDGNPQLIDALARTVGAGMADVNRAAGQLTGREGAPGVDEGGQRTGTVGVEARRTSRERVAKPAPPPPAAGTRHPEPPIGPGGQQPPGPSAEAVWPEAAGAPPSGERGDQPSRAAGPEQQGSGGGPGGRPAGPFGAAHLAGQAGETLRQAGRSVWEAIQGGMGQHGPQPPER
ncbi:hypothetical protein ONA91_03940 [Micromonospora sp. DR5-3]|uniref:hypothetical protein n=1 Tax=unclassified Micromonospora TaxID=2617518 RepID=UPI0011D728F0|nr:MULTISPECIES: hypothetical protein [unclassified Micromonospora]MCW3813608.1 hypothetical protein [Micromonospora sp. DR5-3]TYC25692.1 hypothetical protein FXF52_04550 [Micromonospora sp. MP36]